MSAFTPQAARIPPRPSEPFVGKGFSLLSALFLSAILGFVEFRLHRILHHAIFPWIFRGKSVFQLIASQYVKTSTVFNADKIFSQWNEIFADITLASAILDRVLHHYAFKKGPVRGQLLTSQGDFCIYRIKSLSVRKSSSMLPKPQCYIS